MTSEQLEDLEFLPYGRQTIDEDDIAAVVAVLRSDFLTTGPQVRAFEEAVAAYCGARHAVSVTSGTAGLHAACFAAGLETGDEAIVPAITFVATANALRYLGATPVFCDVHPETGHIDLTDAERRITERTKAILPVHMTGAPGAPDTVAALAERHGLMVIDDAAHSLGARYRKERVGSGRWAAMAVFSFHPVKSITTGEGGVVVTNDDDLAARLRRFRDHGFVRDPEAMAGRCPGPWYYEQHELGFNLRMTDLQAALGSSQLRKLDDFVARRNELAERYLSRLESLPNVRALGPWPEGTESAHHLFVAQIEFDALGVSRREVMQALRERRIGTQVHYIPVPHQPFHRDHPGTRGPFPGAERYYAQALSLPLFPRMKDLDVDRVVGAVGEVLVR